MVSLTKYDRNHARQKAITEGIVNMVVKDLQPAAIVESKRLSRSNSHSGSSIHDCQQAAHSVHPLTKVCH